MVDCGGCGDLLEQNDIELQGERWEETENSEIVLEWRMDLRVLNPLRETTEQSRVNKENSSKLTKLNTSFSLPQIFTMPVTAFQTLVKVNQQVRVSIRIYLTLIGQGFWMLLESGGGAESARTF